MIEDFERHFGAHKMPAEEKEITAVDVALSFVASWATLTLVYLGLLAIC